MIDDTTQNEAATVPVTEPSTLDSVVTLEDAEREATRVPVQSGRPVWSARHVGANEFRIYENDRAIGKTLTPTESASVLAWVKSVTEDEGI